MSSLLAKAENCRPQDRSISVKNYFAYSKTVNDSTGNKYLRLWIEENTESENANTNQFSLMIKLFEYLSCLRTENAIHIN